jgi:hypothetical protein
MSSARGAFATPPSSQVDNPSVLLVDHVLTSGATRACDGLGCTHPVMDSDES